MRGIFHYEVGTSILNHAHTQHGQDVGVIEGGNCCYLTREEFCRLAINYALQRHYLDGYAPIQRGQLLGFVYVAKCARADPAGNAAITEQSPL